jgi:hypothetical protein
MLVGSHRATSSWVPHPHATTHLATTHLVQIQHRVARWEDVIEVCDAVFHNATRVGSDRRALQSIAQHVLTELTSYPTTDTSGASENEP